MEVDEPARVDLSVGRRRQGRQDGVGDRGPSPGILARSGWSKTIFKPGDTITVDFSPARDGSHTGLTTRVTLADGTVLSQASPSVIAARGGHHVEDHRFAFRGARVPAAWIDGIDSRAGDAVASGFYRRVLSRSTRTRRPPRPRGAGTPPRPVAVIDGRAGRPATAPKLTPEYLAKWEVMRKSRMAGSSDTDPNAKCLSAGMPGMMSMAYGMEIQQTKDKITIYGELNDVYRRIYLDGRKPSQRTLDDPTFAGYSVGHWEGDTLVVDTVAMREDTLLDLFSPHSDQLTVHERIRFTSPGILEDRITATDPKALLEPFTQIRTYRKASPPNDELREFSCAEGLSSVK